MKDFLHQVRQDLLAEYRYRYRRMAKDEPRFSFDDPHPYRIQLEEWDTSSETIQ